MSRDSHMEKYMDVACMLIVTLILFHPDLVKGQGRPSWMTLCVADLRIRCLTVPTLWLSTVPYHMTRQSP